jgi:phage-related tail protein
MGGVWDLVKDLNIKVNEETALKIIKRLTPDDWDQIKKDLEEATKENEKAANTLAIVFKIIDEIKNAAIKIIT